MLQSFEGFNDLCTNARGIEIYLNKRKNSVKESGGKTNQPLSVDVIAQEKALYNMGPSLSASKKS